jgi:hypothetical protein
MPENSSLKEALLTVYDIIFQQTEQICDLQVMLVPLVTALIESQNAHLPLAQDYRRLTEAKHRELALSKRDSLARIREEILRVKETSF